MDPDHDRRVSDHVLRMHRYRNEGEQDGEGNNHVTILLRFVFFSDEFWRRGRLPWYRQFWRGG